MYKEGAKGERERNRQKYPKGWVWQSRPNLADRKKINKNIARSLCSCPAVPRRDRTGGCVAGHSLGIAKITARNTSVPRTLLERASGGHGVPVYFSWSHPLPALLGSEEATANKAK